MWNQVYRHRKSQKIKVTMVTVAISLKTWLKRDIFSCCQNEVPVCWVEVSYIFEKKTSPLILIIKYILDTIIVSDSVDPLK